MGVALFPAEVQLLEQPMPQAGSSTTEALPAMNASAWHAAGFTGSGVKIGVIDGGFQGHATKKTSAS